MPVLKQVKPKLLAKPKQSDVVIDVQAKKASVWDDVGPIPDGTDLKRISIYGLAGTGKTHFVGTCPGKILVINCSAEGELKTIDTPENRKRVEVKRLTIVDQIYQLVGTDRINSYDFVVLETATEFQSKILAEVLGVDRLPPQLSFKFASREQWGATSLEFKRCMEALMSVRTNLVVISQEREFEITKDSVEDEFGIVPNIGPALQPASSGWLNTKSDYIVNTYIGRRFVTKRMKVGAEEKVVRTPIDGCDYCMRIGPHPGYITRFRTAKSGFELPGFITDPTYGKLEELM